MKKYFLFYLIYLSLCSSYKAQNKSNQADTVKLTITEAEDWFVKNNLSLLADRYNIDIAKSKVLDAKLWNNPNLNYGQGLYDPHSGRYFDNSSSGTYAVQIQELFSIAGKHTNTAKLAKINEKMSEWQFKDIIRSLKYQLYTDFNTLLTDQQQSKLYDYEIEKLNVLLNGMEQQKQLGVIPGNDIIRLKAEIEDLKNSSVQNYNELLSTEKDIKILLNYNYGTYVVAIDGSASDSAIPTLSDLINTAENNRPDLQVSKSTIEYQMQNIKLQRSLSVPDMTLAVWRDESGSYTNNLEEISLGFDLPLFNRNQHQIKIAKYQLEQAKLNDSLQQNTLENEVAQAYSVYSNLNIQFNSKDIDYNRQLDDLNNDAISNYSKRLINLVDFFDQVRTFTTSRLSYYQLKKQYQDAVNLLNFVTGTTIIK